MTTITTQQTELGWIAFAWRGETLVRLTIGHESPQLAIAAVEDDLGESADVADPTKHQQQIHRRIEKALAGAEDRFDDVDVDLSHLSGFSRKVADQCRAIAPGETLTYADLAAKAGSPGAARAVGNVMAKNRYPLVIPCHRVVGSNGSLGGFSAPTGIKLKKELLRREGVAI